jgi:osmoprotectant transport system permease protein
MTALLEFWSAHAAELWSLVERHIFLVIVSTGVAVLLGVPAGVLAVRRPRLGRPLLAIANTAQTIPSLALFGFLLPLPFVGGVGPRTALVALTLYALGVARPSSSEQRGPRSRRRRRKISKRSGTTVIP